MTDDSDEDDSLPAETHLGRSALRVVDLDGVTAFYRDVVGLDVLRSGTDSKTLGVDATPLLILSETTTGDTPTEGQAGLYHNAFRVPSRGALGDALRRLRSDGSLAGTSDHRVSEALYTSDPEGNGVEIYRDYPRDDWPTTEGDQVAMTTDPLDLDGVRAAADGNSSLPSGTDLGHVHLEVTSLAAFRRCYVDALGLSVRAEMPGATFVAAGGYHHHVGANTWNQRRDPAGGPGLAWFEMVVPGAEALADARQRLSERGFSLGGPRGRAGSDDWPNFNDDEEFSPIDLDEGRSEHSPADSFSFVDPDGIRVRVRAD
jgi:catechol 2,3-dioxygenase